MKNNTKIRLHLTKQLFESLTKQVVAESKGKHYGAGMEEVKGHKAPKMEAMKPMGDAKASKKGGHELNKLKEMKKQLDKQINEMETMTAEDDMLKEDTGAKMAAEQLMKAVSSGDPFATGVVIVLSVVAGLITAGEVVPKLKGYYKALTQKDSGGMKNEGDGESEAAALADLAQDAGINL